MIISAKYLCLKDDEIRFLRGDFYMVKGKKVYDPLTNTWSTGYWLPIYDNRGYIVQYVPVWKD